MVSSLEIRPRHSALYNVPLLMPASEILEIKCSRGTNGKHSTSTDFYYISYTTGGLIEVPGQSMARFDCIK